MDKALTKKELATIAGYTYRRLYDIDMSLPESKKLFVKSEGGKYDLALFVQRWVDYNMGKDEKVDLSLDEVRAVHEQVKTQKTELEVAKMRGQLVDIQEVRQLWGNVAHTVMQNMLRLPSVIAPQVLMMDKPEIVIGIIDKEIRDVLTIIADTPVPNQDISIREETEEGDEV